MYSKGVNMSYPGVTPKGLYSGERAITSQSYTEANIKNGSQFEGSADFGTVATATELKTVFLTGALPVSLKGRTVSFTGEGVQAEVYKAPVYSGGSPAAYQNATDISPNTGISQIIVGATITNDGSLLFAPIYAFGNASNQGKGGVLTLVEPEHILAPNTAYMLKITSLDSGNQKIASHLSWYEGELDLPLP